MIKLYDRCSEEGENLVGKTIFLIVAFLSLSCTGILKLGGYLSADSLEKTLLDIRTKAASVVPSVLRKVAKEPKIPSQTQQKKFSASTNGLALWCTIQSRVRIFCIITTHSTETFCWSYWLQLGLLQFTQIGRECGRTLRNFQFVPWLSSVYALRKDNFKNLFLV